MFPELSSPKRRLQAVLPLLLVFGWFLSPACADDRLAEIQSLLEKGRYARALEKVDGALSQDDLNPLAHYYRGKALFGLQRTGEAFQAFQQVLTLTDPDADLTYRADTKRNMAMCRHVEAFHFLQKKKYSLALERIDESMDLDPTYVAGALFRGKTHELLGNLQKARRQYAKVLKLNPRDSQAMHFLGQVLVALNDLPAATAVFKQLIELGDAQPLQLADAHFRMGDDFRDRFDFSQARIHFEKALSYNKDHVSARLTLDQMNTRVDKIRRTVSAETTLLLAAVFILMAYGILLFLVHRKISIRPEAGVLREGRDEEALAPDSGVQASEASGTDAEDASEEGEREDSP